MSGQPSVAFEQPGLELTDLSQESFQLENSDPTSAFLEKYGSAMIANHRGEMVSVAEAMVCSAFARLVAAGLGEVAMASGAPALPEENEEEDQGEEKIEKTEESEAEEETSNSQDKTEKKVVAKELEESANNLHQEKCTAKQASQKNEHLLVPFNSKQEAVLAKVTSNDAKVVTSIPSGSTTASPPETIRPYSTKNVIPGAAPQEVLITESPAVIETLFISKGPAYSAESKDSQSIIAATIEAPATPRTSAETDVQPTVAEEVSEPVEMNVVADKEIEDFEIQLDESMQIDELYQVVHPEAQVLNIPEYSEGSPEAVIELSVPVDDAEQILLQVADHIEQMEVEETETAYQILDELVQKIAEVQSPVEDSSEDLRATIETEELEKELKEIFIRLFDHVGLEYSPELIESYIKLALRGDAFDLIVKIERGDEENNFPRDRGTHEVIKKLLAAISYIKKSAKHAYQIGRSALRAYSKELTLLNLELHPTYVKVV